MKRTKRQKAIALIAAEMVLERIPFKDACSICCRKYKTVDNYWCDLIDNCRPAAIEKFKKDVREATYSTLTTGELIKWN